jgi:hypothetical protein
MLGGTGVCGVVVLLGGAKGCHGVPGGARGCRGLPGVPGGWWVRVPPGNDKILVKKKQIKYRLNFGENFGKILPKAGNSSFHNGEIVDGVKY